LLLNRHTQGQAPDRSAILGRLWTHATVPGRYVIGNHGHETAHSCAPRPRLPPWSNPIHDDKERARFSSGHPRILPEIACSVVCQSVCRISFPRRSWWS